MKTNFSKLIVGWLLINGTIWIYLSYILAYLGNTQIAETLSKTVVVEILGVILVYCAKACFENISKNNQWPDKKIEDNKIERDC
jgi:ABC-type transport system involved in cytochrome bd biosynthesis fused ATPase/permease subunit